MSKTAVQWLINQIPLGIRMNLAENGIDFDQALEMERQQIIDAWKDGVKTDYAHSGTFEQYYTQTFTEHEPTND
jgi:hypothetical protein